MTKLNNSEAKWACAILAFVLVIGTALAQYTPPSGGGGTNYWTASGSNIFNNTAGNVGIGGAPTLSATIPHSLDIEGLLRVQNDLDNNGTGGGFYLSTSSNNPFIGYKNSTDPTVPNNWCFSDAVAHYLCLSSSAATIGNGIERLASGGVLSWAASGDASQAVDIGLSRIAADTIGVGNGTFGSFAGSLKLTNLSGTSYFTNTVCASGATPAVCGASAAGSVAIPTGVTTVTLVVDTTAVTASSQIILTPDDSITIPMTTCNSTLATLVGGMAVTARVASTSFTITYNGTIATNPLCVSYQIIN